MRFASILRHSVNVVLTVGIFVHISTADAQTPPHSAHSPVAWLPPNVLDRPVTAQQGIGRIHESVSTKSRQAQLFYDQGLAYLQSYVYIEAARSFHQALRSDPQLAMAYLGLSYTLSPMDFTAASNALAMAKSLEKDISPREQLRISIRDLQLKAMVSSGSPDAFRAFQRAIDNALAQFPDDQQFLLLRGNAEEPNPFGNGQGCVASGIPFYERVLASDAKNFAAEHFLTHCYENAGRPQDALPFAKDYAAQASSIPHAHHMYGHVLRRTGGMLAAIEQFQVADRLERAYFRVNNFEPSIDWHYAHNLGLLASSYQFLGRMKDAETYYRRAAALPAHSDFDAFNRKDLCEFLLNRGRYQEGLSAANSLKKSESSLARVAGHALAGSAFVSLAKIEEAARELTLAESQIAQLPPAELPSARFYVASLRAQLQLVQNSLDAQALLARIAAHIRAENGPDAWIQGIYQLERIHRVARTTENWDVAKQFAELMAERAPEYAGSHFALALCARHAGNSGLVESEFASAATYWSHADADLPELIEVRKRESASPPSSATGSKSQNSTS
jgi:tetratricopeptide (TPR) repeat protein